MTSGAPARILVLRYSALGDVVLATSVLEPLRRRFPGARIEWVTDPLYASLLEGLPEIAAVHPLSRDGQGGALSVAARVRGRFDLSIDLQNKVRSALVARSAAPLRTAFRRRSAAQAILSLFGSDPPLVRAHQTALYAEALAPLGIEAPGRTKVSLSEQARGEPEGRVRALALEPVDRGELGQPLEERRVERVRHPLDPRRREPGAERLEQARREDDVAERAVAHDQDRRRLGADVDARDHAAAFPRGSIASMWSTLRALAPRIAVTEPRASAPSSSS